MEEEHKHHFEVRYRRVGGRREIENPCKCSGCEQLVFVEYENYAFRMTLVPHASQITYSVEIGERE